MIIKNDDVKKENFKSIMEELYDNSDVMDYIRAHNLRGGDAIEAMASDIVQGNDIDLDDYNHIA